MRVASVRGGVSFRPARCRPSRRWRTSGRMSTTCTIEVPLRRSRVEITDAACTSARLATLRSAWTASPNAHLWPLKPEEAIDERANGSRAPHRQSCERPRRHRSGQWACGQASAKEDVRFSRSQARCVSGASWGGGSGAGATSGNAGGTRTGKGEGNAGVRGRATPGTSVVATSSLQPPSSKL